MTLTAPQSPWQASSGSWAPVRVAREQLRASESGDLAPALASEALLLPSREAAWGGIGQTWSGFQFHK